MILKSWIFWRAATLIGIKFLAGFNYGNSEFELNSETKNLLFFPDYSGFFWAFMRSWAPISGLVLCWEFAPIGPTWFGPELKKPWPESKLCNCPNFLHCSLLLLDFSRSILVRSSRFHLWINLWSLLNNFRFLSSARFSPELGQNRELQKVCFSAENRARAGEDDTEKSQVFVNCNLPPTFSKVLQSGPARSAEAERCILVPPCVFQVERCSLVPLLRLSS